MDFFEVKGVIESLLGGLHITNATFVASNNALFHPGRGALVQVDDWVIGELGELHPVIREKFDLPAQTVLVGEFDLDALFARLPASYKTAALSRFPGVAQDLALIVDENVPAERVHALIVQTGGALLQRATLFDVYRGDQIAQGKKSLAYALVFQAADRTLSDADATKVREKIVARLKREIGAEVRGGS
jgi:phenylalanyl-tRNA synthetase beta chain